MSQYVYTMNRVSRIVPPKREILKDISLSFFPGAKIGVLGLNGAGKSTLLRIMAGEDVEYEGEARAQSGIRVGYLPQEPRLDPAFDVRGNVEQGVSDIRRLLERFDEVALRFGEVSEEKEIDALLEEQSRLQDAIDAARGWELDRRLEIAAQALRLPPWEAAIDRLSGGECRRVALCRLLLFSPDMLLLDEPTNHLDAESVAWLERYLEEFPGTVIAVTHDRYFLDNVAGWILELDRGRGIPWEGNYSSWLEQKEVRLAQEEREESARRRAIRTELEWIRASPKGRRAKNRARVQRFDELVSREHRMRGETRQIRIPPGPRLGDRVVEARSLRKSLGDRLLIDDLSFDLPPGGIVGVIGANGAGKTTFLRMIAGFDTPDSGSLELGETVALAYVDQSREALDAGKSVWQEISGGHEVIEAGGAEVRTRAYVGHFNFKGPDQEKRVGDLSGGERNRVHLAKLLLRGANLLLLDEPTNDLDVETLRALEEALLDFPGCAVIVSHDRWFLDRLATHILAFEGSGRAVWFQGVYEDYEADRRRRSGEKADPHRSGFKRLDP